MKTTKEESFDGMQLLLPSVFAESPLRKSIPPTLPVSFYTSDKHHPNAVLFHRTSSMRKVKNEEFQRRTQRTVVVVLDRNDLTRTGEELRLDGFISRYHSVGAHVTVFFQRAEELISEQDFTTQGGNATRERLDEWGIRLLLRKVTVFETENERETGKMIGRIAACLLAGVSTGAPTGYEEAAERVEGGGLWLNFLVNIPGVSRAKADLIVQRFPSLPLLMQAYSDPDLPYSAKRTLLEDLGDGQKHHKLSQRIHRLFTSLDPEVFYLA